MEKENIQPLCLDAVLGASEEQTELYIMYCSGVPQLATTHSAKSISGVACSAGKQADVAQRL